MSTEHEKNIAFRNGHEIAQSEAYFLARPQIDFLHNRNIFEAGFNRGWESAHVGITELEAQLTDWKALHAAIATGQPIWPNNWSQEVAMVAHEFHAKNAQLEAAKNANQWQPIETAPKDETLLGFVPHSMGGYLCPIAYSKSGTWFNASCVDFSRVKPSHWKPASYPSTAAATLTKE